MIKGEIGATLVIIFILIVVENSDSALQGCS